MLQLLFKDLKLLCEQDLVMSAWQVPELRTSDWLKSLGSRLTPPHPPQPSLSLIPWRKESLAQPLCELVHPGN